jgi:hypothetical protein
MMAQSEDMVTVLQRAVGCGNADDELTNKPPCKVQYAVGHSEDQVTATRRTLRQLNERLIAQLDHQCLNEIEGLESPTSGA